MPAPCIFQVCCGIPLEEKVAVKSSFSRAEYMICLATSFTAAKGGVTIGGDIWRKSLIVPDCPSNWQCQEKQDSPIDDLLRFLQVMA